MPSSRVGDSVTLKRDGAKVNLSICAIEGSASLDAVTAEMDG